MNQQSKSSIRCFSKTDLHTLRVTMKGREIVGYLDGKKLLEAEDSTFLDVGRIGLWSRSDARSYFDDLKVSSIATMTSRIPEGQK